MSAPERGALLPPTYLGGPQITGENCDREAIHIPGSIQPHGALLVVRADDPAGADTLEAVQASENLHTFLGVTAHAALGQPLAALVGPQVSQAVASALPPGTTDRLQYRTRVSGPQGELALTAHRAAGRLILELEPRPPEAPDHDHRLRNAVFAMEAAATLPDLLDVAVRAARDLSGFDRVMLYRFAEDNSGEVVAESRHPDLAPFLGHKFPESDIPAQARALYVQHLLRLTADVNAAPSPLVPRVDPFTHTPTPLGAAVLRATSPMHLQYLRNMGVASSLSVSVVVGGRLWGLISCHHTAPHVTPPGVRAALEELGRLLNLQVSLKTQADIEAFRAHLAAGHQQVMNAVARSLSPLQALSDPALGVRELLGAGGLAMRLEGEWRVLGATPDPAQLEQLLDWLRAHEEGVVFATHHLGMHIQDAGHLRDLASGVLAVSVGHGWQEALLWFRGELPQVAVWGGATPDAAKTALGPRQSFDSYVEQVRGHSRPWHAGEVAEAQAIGQSLSATLGERLSILRQLNQDLARSNEEWRKFAFVISHDMQEPVRLIKQFMELFSLRQGANVDDQTRKLMDFLTRETTRVGSLTADLYAYTELLSYPELKRQEVMLDTLLQRSLTELAPLAEERQLQCTAPQQAATVQVDAAKLQLALTHLLRNALTFGQLGGQVSVQVEQDDQSTQVHIQDNGPGIPREFQERIFELFQRLGPQGEAGGNGVGLTLARKVAELHGGTLHLESTPGQGSTFTLTLPHAHRPGTP